MHNPMVYLASKSPRRAQLLRQLGLSYEVLDVDVDELIHAGESAENYVRRLALEKALAAWNNQHSQAVPVIGADTCIVLDGQVIGKPADREHGIRILQRLSNRWHRVLTAVAIVCPTRADVQISQAQLQLQWQVSGQKLELSVINDSQVHFAPMTDAEITAYWQSGEPWDKAGAYAIQGKGALFIREVQGSYSGIMGLPLYETGELLRMAGVDVWSVNHEGAQ